MASTNSKTTIRRRGSKRPADNIGCEVYNKGKFSLYQATTEDYHHVIPTHYQTSTDIPTPSSVSQSVRCEVPPPLTEEEPETYNEYIEKRKKISEEWARLRQEMANQMVRNAFPAKSTCSSCSERVESIYRCLDCGPSAFFCEKCSNMHHSFAFLHLPEKWNPQLHCFEECTNYHIWYRPDNHTCETTTTANVVIIDDKGRQHFQGLQFCQCLPLPVIFLSYGLWPASLTFPRVTFTLDFMRTLKAVVLEGQMSLQAFCAALQKCRPGVRRDKRRELVKDLYRVLNWETVLNFMWADHHVAYMQFLPGFPDGTKCSACPQEGDKDGRRIAMDGNMNLVRRGKSGHSVRSPMHEGRFFLSQDAVDEFLSSENEIRGSEEKTCSRFQAGSVIRAKNKTAKLDVTGAFASVCSHDFPCAIFNMRHGERMGYPIFMMKNLENVKVLLYDIGCQLESVLKRRKIRCPAALGCGIFHIYGHQMACQLQYNPRTILGAGLFDGEGTERLWSYLGRFSLITKEMTPENRQDLLTEALLNNGQRLTRKMGDTLAQKLGKAYISQDMAKKTLQDELALVHGVTVNDVDDWRKEEKAMIEKPQKKKEVDPWQETYALRLQEFYANGDQRLAFLSDTVADLIQVMRIKMPNHSIKGKMQGFLKSAEADVEGGDNPDLEGARLEALLRGMERKYKVQQRWEEDSNEYKIHLERACSKLCITKLRQLRDTIVEYSFMVALKSKYSKGQTLQKRIIRQVLEASKKVNTALKLYNGRPHPGPDQPEQLQRSDVSPLQAPIWQHLAPMAPGPDGIPSSTRRKLIDSLNMYMRANEEIDLTSRDLARHLRSLSETHDKLDDAFNELEQKEERTIFEEGALSLIAAQRHRTIVDMNSVLLINNSIKEDINIDEYLQVLSDPESSPDMAEVLSIITSVEEENEVHPIYESED